MDRGRMGRLPWWHRPQAASRVNGDMKARYCPHAWTARPCGQPGSGPNRGGGHVRLPIPAEHQTTKPGTNRLTFPEETPERRLLGWAPSDGAAPVVGMQRFRSRSTRGSDTLISAARRTASPLAGRLTGG